MCSKGTYFNDLSCNCWPLRNESCDLECEEKFDPRQECGCTTTEEFTSLFPAWATTSDIEESMVGQWPVIVDPVELEVPGHWPTCELIDSDCEYSDLNLLACECFVRWNCYNECLNDDEIHDPVDGCTCISKKEYREYFPDWAT